MFDKLQSYFWPNYKILNENGRKKTMKNWGDFVEKYPLNNFEISNASISKNI